MSSEYGQRSLEELQAQLRRSRQEAEDAVPCFAVTEQNWKGLLTLEQKHSDLLLALLKQGQNLMTADEMSSLVARQTEQLRSSMTEMAALTEQYQQKLTSEAKAFTSAAQTAVSDLSKQAGSVSEKFSFVLQEEQRRMRQYETKLLLLGLLPTAIWVLSVLAWALWLR